MVGGAVFAVSSRDTFERGRDDLRSCCESQRWRSSLRAKPRAQRERREPYEPIEPRNIDSILKKMHRASTILTVIVATAALVCIGIVYVKR